MDMRFFALETSRYRRKGTVIRRLDLQLYGENFEERESQSRDKHFIPLIQTGSMCYIFLALI